MADFSAPSFSLGLDFDVDSDPQINVREDPLPDPARQPLTDVNHPPSTVDEFGDDDFEIPMMGPDPLVSDPPRTLKRLRRGTSAETTPVVQKRKSVASWCNVDDEIEDFSSEEDEPPSSRYQSVCRSSKLLLPGHGVLTSQSARKRKDVSNGPPSGNADMSSNKSMFPKLTVSPLRKFQLIDSDSDDLCGNDCANTKASKVAGSSSKGREPNPGCHFSVREQTRKEASLSASHTEDLWNNFHSEKSFDIPTPAFDEVCEEYFRSVKNTKQDLRNTKGYESSTNSTYNQQQLKSGDPLPPAHSYFFHDDMRIQNLVRRRLPNFFPLGAVNTKEIEQSSTSFIDYMGQFSHGESSKQASGKKNSDMSSARSRRNSKRTDVEEVSQGSGSWVNPKCNTRIPKDAGKRRVQAVGQSAGHWYTGSNGKRVYVSKTGQELTGRIAYRHYKKENGGFKTKKSRKKGGNKKK